MAKNRLDFDGEPLGLVEAAVASADERQTNRNEQFRKEWWMYTTYIDQSERDPDLPNIQLPKMYSIIEDKCPKETSALFGKTPIAPVVTKREAFRVVGTLQAEMFDDLTRRAGQWVEGHLLTKLKLLYGTSFQNLVPYYEPIVDKRLVRSSVGGFEVEETKAHRLRLAIETWAPWEVMVDAHATTLTKRDGCRYLIKIQLASKRQIRDLYAKGYYPDLDLDRLEQYRGSTSRWRGEHFGHQMLSALGLPTPSDDDDMGVMLRYESPDRYIDLWQGTVVLRDNDNPFQHKKINCSKMMHVMPPHTQNRFWGIGEAMPNEIQISMLNDLWNLTFATHGMANQPMVFYRKGKVIKEDIVFNLGQRVPVSTDSGRPISDDILIHGGQGLPRDHYLLPNAVERNIDMTAATFDPTRGELSPGDQTATEIKMTYSEGAQRQEGTIQLAEYGFMADYSSKGMSIIDQHANFDDKAEIVGDERAVLLFTASPDDLPGGYNFNFKGSSEVRQLFKKRSALGDLADVLMGSPTARPGGYERKMLELSDCTPEEVDDIQLTPEEVVKKQEQEMAMQLLALQMEAESAKQKETAA